MAGNSYLFSERLRQPGVRSIEQTRAPAGDVLDAAETYWSEFQSTIGPSLVRNELLAEDDDKLAELYGKEAGGTLARIANEPGGATADLYRALERGKIRRTQDGRYESDDPYLAGLVESYGDRIEGLERVRSARASGQIRTEKQLDAALGEHMRKIYHESRSTMARGRGVSGMMAELGGAAIGGIQDPVIAGSMLIFKGAVGGTTARNALKAFAMEAGVVGVSEGIVQANVYRRSPRYGIDYSAAEAAFNTLAAAGGAGVLRAGASLSIDMASRAVFNYRARLAETGGLDSPFNTPEAARAAAELEAYVDTVGRGQAGKIVTQAGLERAQVAAVAKARIDLIEGEPVTVGRMIEGPEEGATTVRVGGREVAAYPADPRFPANVGRRWTPDPGAMPGEPFFVLDAPGGNLARGRAAITEDVVEGTNAVVYRATTADGQDLGAFSSPAEAASAVERALPPKSTAFDWTPSSEPRTTKIGDSRISYRITERGAEIDMIQTPAKKRGFGAARAALQKFVQEADDQGVPIYIRAEPADARTDAERLAAFYRAMGFETRGDLVRRDPITGDQAGMRKALQREFGRGRAEPLDENAPNLGTPADLPTPLPDGHRLLVPTHTIKSARREAMRRRWVHQLLGSAKSQAKPVAYLMGGGGASGKGAVLKALQKRGEIPRTGRAVLVDPDKVKELIPEFERIKELGDSRAASVVHEESSRVAADTIDAAIGKKTHLIIDKTLGDPAKAEKLVKRLRAEGYEVRLYGVTVDIDRALARNVKRMRDGKRLVEPHDLARAHRGFVAAWDRIVELVDRARLYDTTDERKTRISAIKQDGKLVITDEQGYNRFKSKGALNAEAETITELRASAPDAFVEAARGGADPGRDIPGGARRAGEGGGRAGTESADGVPLERLGADELEAAARENQDLFGGADPVPVMRQLDELEAKNPNATLAIDLLEDGKIVSREIPIREARARLEAEAVGIRDVTLCVNGGA